MTFITLPLFTTLYNIIRVAKVFYAGSDVLLCNIIFLKGVPELLKSITVSVLWTRTWGLMYV